VGACLGGAHPILPGWAAVFASVPTPGPILRRRGAHPAGRGPGQPGAGPLGGEPRCTTGTFLVVRCWAGSLTGAPSETSPWCPVVQLRRDAGYVTISNRGSTGSLTPIGDGYVASGAVWGRNWLRNHLRSVFTPVRPDDRRWLRWGIRLRGGVGVYHGDVSGGTCWAGSLTGAPSETSPWCTWGQPRRVVCPARVGAKVLRFVGQDGVKRNRSTFAQGFHRFRIFEASERAPIFEPVPRNPKSEHLSTERSEENSARGGRQ